MKYIKVYVDGQYLSIPLNEYNREKHKLKCSNQFFEFCVPAKFYHPEQGCRRAYVSRSTASALRSLAVK